MNAHQGADERSDTAPEPLDPTDAELRRELGLDPLPSGITGVVRRHPVATAAVLAGVAAAAVVGVKLLRDRRSATVYQRAFDQFADARDSLMSAASELPEHGRSALRRITDRI